MKKTKINIVFLVILGLIITAISAACSNKTEPKELILTTTKTQYVIGEEFDKSSCTVTLVYKNNTEKDISVNDVEWIIPSNFKTETGSKNIKVNYSGLEGSVSVTVNEPYPQAIEFTPPSTNEFIVGEDLDLSGGSIVVVYSDSSKGAPIPLTGEMVSGYDKTKTGDQTVAVTYITDEKSFDASYTVTVISVDFAALRDEIDNLPTIDFTKSPWAVQGGNTGKEVLLAAFERFLGISAAEQQKLATAKPKIITAAFAVYYLMYLDIEAEIASYLTQDGKLTTTDWEALSGLLEAIEGAAEHSEYIHQVFSANYKAYTLFRDGSRNVTIDTYLSLLTSSTDGHSAFGRSISAAKEVYDMLKEVSGTLNGEALAEFADIINQAYDLIMENGGNINENMLMLLGAWKEDIFDILFTYYDYTEDAKYENLLDVILPYSVQRIKDSLPDALNEWALLYTFANPVSYDGTYFMLAYRQLLNAVNYLNANGTDIAKKIYQSQLFKHDYIELDTGKVQTFETWFNFLTGVTVTTGGGGYNWYMGSLTSNTAFKNFLNNYLNIAAKSISDTGYAPGRTDFDAEVSGLLSAYMQLTALQKYTFYKILDFKYPGYAGQTTFMDQYINNGIRNFFHDTVFLYYAEHSTNIEQSALITLVNAAEYYMLYERGISDPQIFIYFMNAFEEDFAAYFKIGNEVDFSGNEVIGWLYDYCLSKYYAIKGTFLPETLAEVYRLLETGFLNLVGIGSGTEYDLTTILVVYRRLQAQRDLILAGDQDIVDIYTDLVIKFTFVNPSTLEFLTDYLIASLENAGIFDFLPDDTIENQEFNEFLDYYLDMSYKWIYNYNYKMGNTEFTQEYGVMLKKFLCLSGQEQYLVYQLLDPRVEETYSNRRVLMYNQNYIKYIFIDMNMRYGLNLQLLGMASINLLYLTEYYIQYSNGFSSFANFVTGLESLEAQMYFGLLLEDEIFNYWYSAYKQLYDDIFNSNPTVSPEHLAILSNLHEIACGCLSEYYVIVNKSLNGIDLDTTQFAVLYYKFLLELDRQIFKSGDELLIIYYSNYKFLDKDKEMGTLKDLNAVMERYYQSYVMYGYNLLLEKLDISEDLVLLNFYNAFIKMAYKNSVLDGYRIGGTNQTVFLADFEVLLKDFTKLKGIEVYSFMFMISGFYGFTDHTVIDAEFLLFSSWLRDYGRYYLSEAKAYNTFIQLFDAIDAYAKGMSKNDMSEFITKMEACIASYGVIENKSAFNVFIDIYDLYLLRLNRILDEENPEPDEPVIPDPGVSLEGLWYDDGADYYLSVKDGVAKLYSSGHENYPDGIFTITDNGDGTYSFEMEGFVFNASFADGVLTLDLMEALGVAFDFVKVPADEVNLEGLWYDDGADYYLSVKDGVAKLYSSGHENYPDGIFTITDNGDGTYSFEMEGFVFNAIYAGGILTLDLVEALGVAFDFVKVPVDEVSLEGLWYDEANDYYLSVDDGIAKLYSSGHEKYPDGIFTITDNGDGTYSFEMEGFVFNASYADGILTLDLAEAFGVAFDFVKVVNTQLSITEFNSIMHLAA